MVTDIKREASKAKKLLNDETFMEIMDRLRNRQVETFLTSAKEQIELRETAHDIVAAITLIEDELHAAIAEETLFDKKHQ
tara:strand:- start:893 stop:1132 length:240 start_codon:yes stop_codon:yes gene_type:complete